MRTLYIVPTLVGDMEDMTIRAIHIPKEMDLALAEDTRTLSRLLKHHNIQNHLLSHHKFNERGTSTGIAERLKAGQSTAFINDAGTPGTSDPGLFLAREAAKAGTTVQTLPGTTACIPAVVSSGLLYDRFCFEGFLLQKKGRQAQLEAPKEERRTMVFYESPYRLLKTLQQFADISDPDRPVSVVREISKLHEEHVRGTFEEVTQHSKEVPLRGEIVTAVGGDNKNKKFKTEQI